MGVAATRGEYDGIVLGTGHNGLVLQAYLARAGVRCLALDRAAVAGGGLATVENPRCPGFLHNTHSFFHRALTAMPWFEDLELTRHGVEYIEPELNVALVLRDGRVLKWWRDSERTLESAAEFSQRDAVILRRWMAEFEPIVRTFVTPEARSAPLPVAERTRFLEKTAQGRRLLEVSRLSPLEFVMGEFENEVIQAGLLFFNGLREVDLRLPGFGHSIPSLLASPHKAQMCVGGSAALARGLIRDIREHGGEVRCGESLKRLLVENERVVGVELEDGEQIRASRFVASGLNPQQTLLDLLPAAAVPEAVRNRARDFRYNIIAPLFALNLALTEPPQYRALDQHPELADALMVILGLESVQQFHQIVEAHEVGRIPTTVAWGACPTRFDPSQAPRGGHTAFLWEKVPYSLACDPEAWRAQGPEHARQLLSFWSEFAPNLRRHGVVLDSFHTTPLDTVSTLPNMHAGDLLVGSFAHDQVGDQRPFPGAGGYRTPIPGLYLCGGSTHPGGNVTGLCGYNAARVIVNDLGMDPWWGAVDVRDAWPSVETGSSSESAPASDSEI